MAAIAVESVLERDGQFTGSTLWQEFRLYRDVRSVDVRVRLLWRERRVALKLAFPLFVKMYPEATVEIPFGTAMVPTDGVEAPGLAWADAAGETDFTERGEKHWHGVTVANTASYSYSFRHHFPTRALTLAMMVARGNPYTEASPHGTTLPTPGYDLQDEGLHELSYSIVPHLEGWREAGSHRRAAELTRPLIVLPESVHLGDLPARASIFSCSHGSIELGAIKAADDGDGLIVRLYEAYGAATRGVAITCAGRQWTADFRAGEVKTFRLPSDGGAAAAVDLLEATRLS
jgi:alpha-mannosidase